MPGHCSRACAILLGCCTTLLAANLWFTGDDRTMAIMATCPVGCCVRLLALLVLTKGAPGMPLTAWLLCWGDLGRYEAHYYGLPTLREYYRALQITGLREHERSAVRGPR